MISRAGMMPRAVEGVGMLTGKWESGGGGEEGSKEAGTHLSKIEREKLKSRFSGITILHCSPETKKGKYRWPRTTEKTCSSPANVSRTVHLAYGCLPG